MNIMNNFKIVIYAFCTLLIASCSSSGKKPDVLPSPAPVSTSTVNAVSIGKSERFAAGISCSLHGDFRKIEINPRAEGCEVHYQKPQKSDVIATSVKGFAYCETIRDRVRRNLEGVGFKCD